MSKGIRMLVMVLLLVVGTAPVALARGGPGGFHGGSFGHSGFHDGFHGGHVGPFHHPHFHGGIIVGAPPLWIAPEPSIDVTPEIGVTPAPAPLWYYCANPPGYYPMVPTCQEPWIPVNPQP